MSETAIKCKEALELLLYKLGITARVVPHTEPFIKDADNTISPITLDIRGEDLGILIGRRGQTLASLQYILRLMVTHETKSWTPVIIDVEGYKQRRYQSLQSLALRIADQVKTSKSPFKLEAMPSFERRIIHLTLADHPEVTTFSTGEGESRRVVIATKE